MKLTIWYEKGKYMVSGHRFFAVCEKLYINDSLTQIEADSKIILDAWEIRLGKIKNEKNNAGSWNYIAEEVSLYTMPYLITRHLAEEFGDNNTLAVKVVE